MSANSPTIDIVDNDFIIEGNISYFGGTIDATDDLGQFTIDGSGAFTMPTYFINNEVSNLQVQRIGTVTQAGAINVDNNFTLNHIGTNYDLNSNTITISKNFTPTNGKIHANSAGSAFKVASSALTSVYSGNTFNLNTINQAYFERSVTLNNNFTFGNLLNVKFGNAAFGNTTITVNGNIVLDNNGSITTGVTNLMTFPSTSVITNNSTGSLSLNDVTITGNLSSNSSINLGGNLNNSGVTNLTSGTMTFQNAVAKSITNTGTLDFNYVNIASGSDVRTTSSFDINNDFRMVDNTSVFVASSPSQITLGLNNLQIFAETNSDGANTGLTFYSISFGNSLIIYFRGAFDFYINGNYISNNSRVYFEDNSNLYLTSSTPSTPFFSYLTVFDLTFTSTANFSSYNIQTTLNNSLNINVGGMLNTNSTFNITNNSVVFNNPLPNTSSNLNIRNVNLTNGTLTTNDSFTLRQNLSINASSTLNQTSGTFTKSNGSITNNGEMTINEFEIIGVATTTTDMTITGNYYLQNPVNSFTATAGSITFTNPNLVIENAGTTQFFDLYLDDAVTNGATDDDFTIAGDLELGTTARFTASSPSEITFSGNGVLTCPTFATGGLGLYVNDLNFTGNYNTNIPASTGHVIFQIGGDLNVDGSFVSGQNTAIRFAAAGTKNITNNGTLTFEYFWLSFGSYQTNTDFNINDRFYINAGTTFTANDGTLDMIIGIPHQSLASTRAEPVATDTIFGIDYTFSDLDAYINSTSYISNGTVYKNGRKQNLFGFELETENTAKFTKIILEYKTTGGLVPANHFTSIRLWQDINNNKVADPDETVGSGVVNGKFIVFENFATQMNFSGTKNFIITADIRNDAPINSTIQLSIPNESYLFFDRPVVLEAGGPFLGAVRTVKNANVPVAIIVSNIFPDFIQSGDNIDVTIKLIDSDGNETISDDRYDFTINAIGDVTKSGNSANSVVKGESYITIQNYKLTNDDGASPVYIVASSNNFSNANSITFTVFPPGPVSLSSGLLLSAGDPAISSISVNSWTNGSGDGRIIVARLGKSPISPSNRTSYIAENNASLSQINSNQTSPGSYVIYNGSAASNQFKFKGLASGQKYYFKIYDYKLFNNIPVYINSKNNPTYIYETAYSADPYTENVDSDNAITIYEDDVINGVLYSNEEEDWYKFTKSGKNLLVNSCGEFKYIDLYKFDATAGKLKLLRRTQNTGSNCQIIIINEENVNEEYYLKIHKLNDVFETQYQFKVRSYNYELFSKQSCDCP